MTIFYILGGCLAGWAVLVAFLGIARENFPATPLAERLVATISIALVAAAIGSAIVASANEAHEEEGAEAAALTP